MCIIMRWFYLRLLEEEKLVKVRENHVCCFSYLGVVEREVIKFMIFDGLSMMILKRSKCCVILLYYNIFLVLLV